MSFKIIETFPIEFNGKHYDCNAVEDEGTIVYMVNFGETKLLLTQGTSQQGEPFWTTIPQDLKLKQVARQLGEKIENHNL
jgi:hypothetical protein